MAEGIVERLGASFEPRGVIVAGASPHPGRFGTVVLHNLLASGSEAGGYAGPVFATSREGGDVLGVETAQSVDELPDGYGSQLHGHRLPHPGGPHRAQRTA